MRFHLVGGVVLFGALLCCAGALSRPRAAQPGPLRFALVAYGEVLVGDGSGRSLRIDVAPNDQDGQSGSLGNPVLAPDASRVAYFARGARGTVLVVTAIRGPRRRDDRVWSDGHVDRVTAVATHPRDVTPPLRGRYAPDLTAQPQAGPWWSPDGSKLAYVRRDANVVVVEASSRRRWLLHTRRLADPAWDYGWSEIRIAWAPDGRRLAVSGTSKRTWIATLGSPRLRLLARRQTRDAAWSPDGTKLAYVRGDRRGNGQIWVVSSDGRRAHRLTNDVPLDRYAHFSNTRPVWSPDGRRVAFLSDRDGRRRVSLFVIGADGRDERRLTRPEPNVASPPRWSRDGSRLAVVVFGRRGLRPWVLPARGGAPRLFPFLPQSEYGYNQGVDWGWRAGGGRARVRAVPLPRRVPIRWIVARRDHAPAGRTRIVDAHLVPTGGGYTRVESVNADGTLVATITSTAQAARIDLLDLVHGTRRRVVGSFSAAGGPTPVELSRDGRSLLYYRRGPVVVRLADGRTTRIATRPELGPAELLRDGRVAYVSRGGQLMFVRPGRRPVGTRLWLPGRPVNFSISPEGRRLVYTDPRDRLWLLDRATGHRRRLPPGLAPGPFSPDGRLIALTRPVATNDGPGIDAVLYRVDGKRIGSLIGNRTWAEFTTPSWSVDGRWLTMPLQYPGSRPPPPYILAYSVATGRVSRLPGSAGTFGSLVVGPNGQVVVGRDVTHGAVPRTLVMVGRLTG